MTSSDAYKMGRDVSPSSGDDKGGEDVVRSHARVAVRKVSNNKGGKPSSSRG
jgi:hypothetical protein